METALPMEQAPEQLNESQQRRLRITCEHVDKLLLEVEGVLEQSTSHSVFPRYTAEIPPAQKRTIEGYLARIRAQLLRVLDGQNILRAKPSISPVHSLNVSLTFMEIAIEELYPKYMRGFGPVPETVAADLNGIVGELLGILNGLHQYVMNGVGDDLKERIRKIEGSELALLQTIERIVAERGLVEFRSTLSNILDRLEDNSFEIAVFGRVSSGKSSLLNGILGTNILPVGVTPVTAVPTKIRHGSEPLFNVTFADRPSQAMEIARLPEFASEQQNPGNRLHVSKIVVQLPAARLQDGVTFVDTPGLGSLASSGAAETRAYLPKCDLGVVLVDAASTLTLDDIQTVLALHTAAIPVTVLLSKSDLLNEEDRASAMKYVRDHILSECQMDISVHPVSTIAGHRALLDDWFVRDILPMYSRAKELRAASVNRKVSALRNSLISTLQFRRGRASGSGDSPKISPEQTRRIEAQLRIATGRIEKVSLQIENETQRMPLEIEGPFQEAAAALAETSAASASAAKKSQQETVRRALIRAIQNRAQLWRQQLEELAHGLEQTLIAAARDLEVPDEPTEGEFAATIREMPVFDPPSMNLAANWPARASLFGKKFAMGHLVRKLESQAGAEFSDALGVYSSLVRKWAEGILKELKMRFDGYADNDRAQAENSQTERTTNDDDQQRIIADLKLLGADEQAGLRRLEVQEDSGAAHLQESR